MKPPELVLSVDEMQAMKIINSFVAKQQALAISLRAKVEQRSDAFSLRYHAPAMVNALNETWLVAMHGLGARFTSMETGEVVDLHSGMFIDPGAFDAWRLESYAESIGSGPEEFGPILERLAAKEAIRRHPSMAHHYELLSLTE